MLKQEENRPYHHGDLRRALLDAAFQLVAERGIPDFTLREVARQAGVSHNAPYHHFADKSELVVALTVEGFHMLKQALDTAYVQTTGTPLARILAIGSAYIHFALEHPAIFNLMFRPELRQPSHNVGECDESVKTASDATFQVLLDAIVASQQASELRVDQPVEMLALALGSTMHGLTVLLLDGLMVKGNVIPSREETEQLMAQVMHIVVQGLIEAKVSGLDSV